MKKLKTKVSRKIIPIHDRDCLGTEDYTAMAEEYVGGFIGLDTDGPGAITEDSQEEPKAQGSTILLVDNAISDLDYQKANLGFTSPDVADKLRAKSGRFWVRAENNKDDITAYYKITDTKTFNPLIMNTVNVTELYESESMAFFEMAEPIIISKNIRAKAAVKRNFFSTAASVFGLDSFDSDLIDRDSDTFLDHTMRISSPLDKEQLDLYSTPFRPSMVSVDAEYNFYQEDYEIIAKKTNSEVVMSNFYSFFLDEQYEISSETLLTEPVPETVDYEPVTDSTGVVGIRGTISAREPSDSILSGMDLGMFDSVDSRYSVPLRPETIEEKLGRDIKERSAITNRYSNLFFVTRDVGKLQEINKNKNLFPMYVDTQFSTDVTTEFAESLKSARLARKFQTDAISLFDTASLDVEFLESRESLTQYNPETIDKTVKTEKVVKRIIDLEAWITSVPSIAPDQRIYKNSTYYTVDTSSEEEVGSDASSSFIRSLMSLVLSEKVKTIVKNNFRSFKEMIDGKPCYSETVLYRIEKKSGNQPIQDFYFLNANDIDIQSFIDTQVKYGKEYTYTLYCYEMVVGTSYNYRNMRKFPGNEQYVLASVVYRPSVKLVEIEKFSKTVKIVDSPNAAPDVEVVPFKGNKNKFRMLLNSISDRYLKEPVIVEDSELASIEDIMMNQDLKNRRVGKILYNTDDHPVSFEVYRINEHPSSYKDFAGSKLISIKTDVSLETKLKATTATYDDHIQPNRKYYYLFRTVDVHGNLSYPSEVHQVEIVDNSGIVFLLHDVVEMKKIKPTQPSISFKKYLHIKPSFENLEVNETKSNINSSILEGTSKATLGIAEEGAWNRKFRMRVTSKKTGKKIDLDFQFTQTENTNES